MLEPLFILSGTHDSFAFELTSQPGPDLAPTLRYLRVFIQPIIRNWSITQDKTFTGKTNRFELNSFHRSSSSFRTIIDGYSIF